MGFQVVLYGKSSQEYLVNAGDPQCSILCHAFFLLYINDLPDKVICYFAIYEDDTTLCSKCDQEFDLRLLNLNLTYKTLWTGAGSGLLISLLEKLNWFKTQVVWFDWSNNTGAIDVKMDGSVLVEKSSFKMPGLTFSSKLD